MPKMWTGANWNPSAYSATSWRWPANSTRSCKEKKPGVISLSLVLLGVDVVLDATLQLVRRENGESLLEIIGIKPA